MEIPGADTKQYTFRTCYPLGEWATLDGVISIDRVLLLIYIMLILNLYLYTF